MVYLLKMVIFHGKLLNNQMVSQTKAEMGSLPHTSWFRQAAVPRPPFPIERSNAMASCQPPQSLKDI